MEYAEVAIIPLLIGILEILKRLGINEKQIPIISVIAGLGLGIILFSNGNIKSGVIRGLYIGLSAVGLYSGTKNTIEGIR